MKYWQKARNYRKYERGDGTFVHIITVDGEDVEVSAEVTGRKRTAVAGKACGGRDAAILFDGQAYRVC